MDLTTRCPHCGSTFSASLDQLQLRKGYIRCINCANIFDGFDAVVPNPEADPPVPAPVPQRAPGPGSATPHPPPPADSDGDDEVLAKQREPSLSMPSVLRQRPINTEAPTHTISAPPIPAGANVRPAFTISANEGDTAADRQDPVFKVGATAPLRPDPVIGPSQSRPSQHALPTAPVVGIPTRRRDAGARMVADQERPAGPTLYVEPRHDRSPDLMGPRAPEFLHRREEGGHGSVMRHIWVFLTLVGMLVLLAQLTYVYRAQIANNVPVLRPVLERVCARLDCDVPYSRRIDQIAIVSSSLRAVPQPAMPVQDGSDTMILQLVLRNSFDKAQEWPSLVLDLTDFSGTVVVRKNLPPDSYLTEAQRQQPFSSSSEMTISVPLALNGLKVNGYQLDKFYH